MGHIESILAGKQPFQIRTNQSENIFSTEIGNKSEDFVQMSSDLQMITDLLGGTKPMREASTRYLPMWEAESITDYNNRLQRTFLFDGLRKNLRTIVAKPFSRPVQFSDYSDIFLDWFKNINLLDTTFSIFLKNLFWSMIGDGATFILVDMPATKDRDGNSIFANREEEKKANIRPYMCQINSRDILGVKTFRNGVKEDVEEIRIQETVQIPHGDYGTKTLKRVRLFRIGGSWELWQEVNTFTSKNNISSSKEVTYRLIDFGNLSIDIIPIVPIYANRKGLYLAESVLKDVAWKNLESWQDGSCQNNALSFARVPMIYITGYNSQDGQIVLAPNSSIRLTDPNAKVGYVEDSGSSIMAGERNGMRIKEEMNELGVRLMNTVFKTATESIIDSADEDSETKSHIEVLERGAEDATRIMALFDDLNIEKNIGKVKIFKEFDLIANRDKDMIAIGDMNRRGTLDKKTELEEAQRRNVVSEDINTEEVIIKAEKESIEAKKLEESTLIDG